jgi:murein DD-endopeptidase MepM/ murein hydrolase activator NlpD
MRRPGLARAGVALLASGLLVSVPARTQAGGPTYYLPVPEGTSVYVTQGNNTGDHIAAYESQYAFDFALAGDPEFPVAAARAGTVLAVRSDSTVNCPAEASCWDDWTQANYVLIDHGDKTSALYVHLATGTVTVKAGDRVAQGQVIAQADSTGFSSANHLHFQVEQTPAPSAKAGWWWSQSVQIAFSDPAVLARFPGGVPTASDTPFVSGNVEQAAPQGPTLSGAWVAPKDGAKLTTSAITLSAKPTVTPAPLTVTKVAFSIKWGYTTKAACSATKAGSGGVWSCNVDLWKLGAPLGKLTLSFDVFDHTGDVAHSPDGPRSVTYAAPPPVPTGASATLNMVDDRDISWVITIRAKWQEPPSLAASFLLYGVIQCSATGVKGTPCLLPGRPITSSMLKQIGAAPAGADSMTVTYKTVFGIGPEVIGYPAYVLAARNAAGRSPFVAVYNPSYCWCGY